MFQGHGQLVIAILSLLCFFLLTFGLHFSTPDTDIGVNTISLEVIPQSSISDQKEEIRLVHR